MKAFATVVFVLTALLLVSSGCGKSERPSAVDAVAPVAHAPVGIVQKQSAAVRYEAVGTVRARVASTIQSKLTGHVQAVKVAEGDHVDAGQVLVMIDARESDAQVKRAEAALGEAREARREVDDMVQAAVHAKAAADAGSALAEATFKRFSVLQAKEAISKQMYDEADAKFKGAAAEMARAEEMVQSAQAKRGELDARIEQASAELTSAQTALSFATITAPFAGIIIRKTVDVGDLALPGNPLLVIEDPNQYRLEAQVSEKQVHEIAAGATAMVSLDSTGAPEVKGTVSEVVPSADPASRTFVVKINLPKDAATRSGMFGRAAFDIGQRESVFVPKTAVLRRGQLVGVYVVGDGDIARLRLITVGKEHDGAVEVLSGLEPGERFVTDKVDQVSDGAKIQS